MTAPKRASRLRRLLVGVLVFFILIALAVVTTPWWWASAIRGVLTRQGVTFGRFETLGYSRFALHDVRFENATVPVNATVARVEADTPLVWLVHACVSHPGPVLIETWQVTATAPDKKSPPPPSSPSTIDGWPALRTRLNEILATLQRWLPEARVTDGTVLYEKQKLTVTSLHWLARDGQLTADGLSSHDLTARAELRWLSATSQLNFSAATSDQQWSASLSSVEDTVTGQLQLWKQPAELRATFPAHGWIPQEASLTVARLNVPGNTLGLSGLYPVLSSQGRIVWKDARFILEFRADGPPADKESTPPLHVEIAGQGDAETLRIERLDISFPGTTARLTAPVVIDHEMQIRSGTSRFSLESDLEKLPGLETIHGKINGLVLVEISKTGEPHLTAKLEAAQITAPDFDLKSAVFEAEQTGSLLTLKNARLAFTDGSDAEARGRWNWNDHTVTDGQLDADIKPAAFARWLPASLSFTRLKVSAKAGGLWPELKHSGEITLTELVAGTPKPVSAAVKWTGTGLAATLTTDIETGGTSVALASHLRRDQATLDSLDLTLPGAPALKLAQPARIRWLPSLSIESLDLTGETTRISLAWSAGEARGTRVETAGLRSEWLRDFLPDSLPRWQVESATLEGRWPSGPFEGSMRLIGQVEITQDKNARLELAAHAQSDGLHIDRLFVSDENGVVLEASGAIPLIITPATAPFWKLDPAGSWSLSADTTPDSPFWKAQAEASGIKLHTPHLNARIEGSVKKPNARIELQAGEIAFDRIRLPTLSNLDALLVLDEDRVELEKLSLLVAGQALNASGRTNVKADQWSAIIRDPRQLWTGETVAKLHLPLVEIAALAAFLPDAFAPTGSLQGDLTVRANGEIDGTLKLDNVSTHPILPFGSFSEISGEIAFSGRKADLKSLTALASGQAIKASGSVAFPESAPLKIDLSLSGKNLPIVRQTGLLIRGDLDLNVKSTDDGGTLLSGEVNVHDSLFLADIRSLIPTRGGSPASRPPYFSVTAPPFRDWRLALKVGGERFMTIRTPLFNGVASGQLQLSGTLFEPIAIGQVHFNEGTILLPFAALRLTAGTVRLTQTDPYSPQLFVNAAARTLGYDVRMELSGPASDLSVTFSSSPSLSSEQVLLMVMAGETPRSDFSYSGTQRATSIGVYLGKSLFSDFFGDPTAAEKFTYSTGENISEAGKETYNVEYKLNNRWSLVGERDEFDDYNAGVKLRIFTSKKKKAPDAATP